MPKEQQAEALVKLGRRIRARRYFLQLPLGYFARETRLSTSMLNAYEAGRNHPPAMTLKRIAKALGTTTSDLLAERGKVNTEDVEFAVSLFAEPSIYAMAMAMLRMKPSDRQDVAHQIAASASWRST